ncbi:MAG: Mg2+ transporter protein CorA-like protein [Herminiimonas sp.]|nr:Mg2+ transporter protein CorA-like protein [Herminiimonas sp.]
MELYLIGDSQVIPNPELPAGLADGGFIWLDSTHDEVAADPEAWLAAVARTTGVLIYEPHVLDVVNLKHPSYFDSTQDYQLVVFRKLAPEAETGSMPATDAGATESGTARPVPNALSKLTTRPVSFLVMDHALVTVHAVGSRTIEAARARLLDFKARPNGNSYNNRPPLSPQELMLRLLNAMVDQYLDLRLPLTLQVERWQRLLLNPNRQFNDWTALLDARNSLHKLDLMCEEQHDALQELRDHFVDSFRNDGQDRANDLLLVRLNDVMEHITRVLNHARRLESSIESAVQIHFSAMAHRTSEIMRTLTVITALFMPLTLITGVFGMNFEVMPLLKDKTGFWITVGIMAVIVVGMLFFFRRKRYLDD